jgi:hypothetical protein
MTWVFVFTATVIADVIWTEWSKAVTAKHAELAGLYAAGIILCGAFVTIEYVRDSSLVLPAALGAMLGTWLSVRRA